MVQTDHFVVLIDEINETIEQFMVTDVIQKRPFKYADGSLLYSNTWQKIIADINFQV